MVDTLGLYVLDALPPSPPCVASGKSFSTFTDRQDTNIEPELRMDTLDSLDGVDIDDPQSESECIMVTIDTSPCQFLRVLLSSRCGRLQIESQWRSVLSLAHLSCRLCGCLLLLLQNSFCLFRNIGLELRSHRIRQP